MVPKKILVAHDFSEPSDRALAFASDLAKRLGASLEVVHVHPEMYDGYGDPAVGVPWPSSDQGERYLRFLEAETERAVRNVLGDDASRVRCHLVRGEPAKRIDALAADIGADMVCLGSTGKGAVERVLLGSVSQRVLRTCKVPVVTVH